MASIKPSVPKGTRDFSPTEMVRRNLIFDTIKGVFRKYGYQQIETPAMENLSTLMGKYGDEGDKLIFKILDNGEYLDLTTLKLVWDKFHEGFDELLENEESESLLKLDDFLKDAEYGNHEKNKKLNKIFKKQNLSKFDKII